MPPYGFENFKKITKALRQSPKRHLTFWFVPWRPHSVGHQKANIWNDMWHIPLVAVWQPLKRETFVEFISYFLRERKLPYIDSVSCTVNALI